MANNRYWAIGLTGGSSGFLDALDPSNTDGAGTVLAAGDTCDIIEDDMVSHYIAKSSAGMVESSPDIIIPDNNPGTWYWQLIERKPQDEAMITALLYANTPGGF